MKKQILVAAGGLCLTALTACATPGTTTMTKQNALDASRNLLEDTMTGDWQENWFLDGKKATLENREDGLHFTATPSDVDKKEDRAKFDAHHAVLWTKREFEGDIRISYEFTRVSKEFTFLLYMHAQGVGTPPYVADIAAWRELREISAMKLYFTYMNLTGVTFREQIRLRRYPWLDADGVEYDDNLIGQKIDYDRIPEGQAYRVDIELRSTSFSFRLEEVGNPKNVIEQTHDLAKGLDPRRPVPSTRGRIGLRHMGGTAVVYKNFQVRQL